MYSPSVPRLVKAISIFPHLSPDWSQTTQRKLWRDVSCKLGYPKTLTSASFALRTNYEKFLKDYENRCAVVVLCVPAHLMKLLHLLGCRVLGFRVLGF